MKALLRTLACVLAVPALLATGACGVGGGLAAAAGGGGGGGGGSARRPPPPPRVDLTAPSVDPASDYVTFLFVLNDPRVKPLRDEQGNVIREGGEDDPRVRIFPEYAVERVEAPAGGGPVVRRFGEWQPMTPAPIAGSEGTRALGLGDHTFVWNTLVDVPAVLPPMTGRVRARLRAEYEPTAGLRRRFRVREVTFRLDNRLAGTIFGGGLREISDVDTFPVDVRATGTSLLVADAGAGIVERVEATGRTLRVIGVGVPGTSGDGGDPGVARLEDLTALAFQRGTGLIFTNHGSRIRVTNPTILPRTVGAGQVAPRTIVSTGLPADGARAARMHPSGALLYIDGRARILAFNTRSAGDIVLAGVTIAPGDVGQIAGDGATDADGTQATLTALTDATSLAVGPDGEIYYGEQNVGRVRVINPNPGPLALPVGTVDPGAVLTVAGGNGLGFSGDGGAATAAQLNRQDSLDCSRDRRLFVADTFNSRCRLVNLGAAETTFAGVTVGPGEIGTVAGGGNGGVGSRATDLALGPVNAVAIGDQGLLDDPNLTDDLRRLAEETIVLASDTRLILVNGATATVTAYGRTALGGRTAEVYDASRRGGLPLDRPVAVHASSPDEVFFSDQSTVRVLNLRSGSRVFGGASAGPGGVAAIAGGAVPGFSGDGGPARAAAFGRPAALATDGPFRLYVADTGNDRVRFVNIGDPVLTGELTAFGKSLRPGFVDTIVGGGLPAADDGDGLPPDQATLSEPQGLVVAFGLMFVADTGNHRVRCVNPGPDDVVVAGTTVFAGTIRTIFGGGAEGFTADGPGPWLTSSPTALAIDGRGILYIAEAGNARIRALNTGLVAPPAAGVTLARVPVPPNEVATLVGTGERGNFGDGGGGPEALIDAPSSLIVQSLADGTPLALYFADSPQHVIRMLNLTSQDVIVSVNADGTAETTLAGGGITSIAGGPNAFGAPNAPAFAGTGDVALEMRFSFPAGIAVTNFQGRPAHFIVADRDNGRLRRFGAPPLLLTSE